MSSLTKLLGLIFVTVKQIFIILALLCSLALLSSPAWATTYYVCATTGSPCNASDSNAGTSKTATWLHAPGMSTATGTAASTVLGAGDSLIFRGGDTWHFGNSGLLPFAGFQTNAWSFTRSGTTTTCNLNAALGAITTSTCIYIGVDQTWFSGGSFARPIFNFDNTLTNTSPASCQFDDTTLFPIAFSGNYLIVDNLEVVGVCSNATNTDAYIFNNTGSMQEFKNLYVHGYMLGQTCTNSSADCDEYWFVGGVNSQTVYQRYDHNVFDNSDGTFGNSSSSASFGVFNQSLLEADHNVLNQVSNGLKYRYAFLIHDNLFQNMFESAGAISTHGNIIEWQGTGAAYATSTYYFNNLTTCPGVNSNIDESVDMYPGGASSSKQAYIFNNISNCNYFGGIGTNCYMIEGDGGNGGPGHTQFFNNTTINPCQMRGSRGNSTGLYQNNHFVGFAPSGSISNFSSQSTATDNGNEVWQTAGAACGTSGTNYAPTSGGCATVGAGANLSSLCSGMDNAIAAAACGNAYGGVTYNATTHTAVDNTPVTRSSTWDVGAYQFSIQRSLQRSYRLRSCSDTKRCWRFGGFFSATERRRTFRLASSRSRACH